MVINKCIILAGGYAKRLRPMTEVLSKHLMPIYNKPMIYYPISTAMEAGIRKFLIITKKEDLNNYKKLLGNGKNFGISISYKIQKKPIGIPEAFLLGQKFINKDPVCLNLGDHIFFGKDVKNKLKYHIKNFSKSTIFTYTVNKPNSYGVLYKNKQNNYKIIEKPKKIISNKIICGLYLYTSDVVSLSKKLKLSKRSEIEISDLNNIFLSNKCIKLIHINKNNTWADAGNPNNILKISNLIKKLEVKYDQFIG